MEDLKMRRYVAIIDKSGSMGEAAKSGIKGRTRWQAAAESTVALARKCEELGGTLDVYTFNSKFNYYPAAGADKVAEIFKEDAPNGGTDFVPVLKHAFDEHFKSDKPSIFVILTDGEPSGQDGQKALAKLIVDTTQKLEGDGELGLQFLQVGDDPKARTFLKNLDDGLQRVGAKFDIVDTKTCDELEGMRMEDALLGAVND